MGRAIPGLVLALLVGIAAGWAISTPVGVIVGVVVAVTLLPLLWTRTEADPSRAGSDPRPRDRNADRPDED